jgi:hypothetical protein
MWMVAALTLATVILVEHIADTEQFRSISDDGTQFAALCVTGLACVLGLSALFVRFPQAFPLLVVGVLPFRVPVAAAGTTANLLVPLYLVIAAGCVAHIWRRAPWAADRERRDTAGREHAAGSTHDGDMPRSSGSVASRATQLPLALAVFVVLYGLQSLYSKDFDTALEQMVFFLVPFAVLFGLLLEVRWSRSLVLGCLGVAVALALVFVTIGFWEYHERELLWNPKVIASNQLQSYFRVNSVFWDPNVYGRFLMLVMLAVTASMLWSGRVRAAAASAMVLALLWGGLVLTFSQSSFAALLAGLVVLAALRWDARRTVAVAATALAVATVFVIAFQGALKIHLNSSSGLDKVTSGRSDLVSGGADLFAKRPVWGWGSGAFGRAFRLERKGNQQEAVSASHTLPVTVAAEQGLIGLAAYVAVLIAAFRTLFGNRLGAGAARAPPLVDGGVAYPARAAVAAMFCALVVHTMAYAAFLEDPFSWVLMALGISLAPSVSLVPARMRPPRRAPAPAAAAWR